ncbi:MAG: T9SS type A sorting domain-containing protein [Cytophagaceae bacterium]|nr:T9SS type A sorting domain-containing protein [Cytophagaceae bacterium]
MMQYILALSMFIVFSLKTQATVYTVTLATDGNPFGGGNAGDLRWTILQANAAAGTGPHVINFNLPGGAPYNIPLGAPLPNIPNITGGITINGFSQTGWVAPNPVIHIDGPGYGDCFNITGSSNSLIQGFAISDFQNVVTLTNSMNTILRGLWIGLNATPANVGATGGYGIRLIGSDNCSIGGDVSANPEHKILITGRQDGLWLSGGSDNNTVYGVYFAVNLAGTASLGTISSNCVYIDNSAFNQIGNTGNGRRCVMTNGNQYGVFIQNAGSRRNKIYNCLIGTDINGTIDLGNNSNGVRIQDAHNNEIGGRNAGEGNIISGNNQEGIFLTGNSDSTLIGRNYLGLGSNGTTVIVNGTGAGHHGINVNGSACERTKFLYNIIVTPNRGSGVYYDGGGNDSIVGNYFGVDATGLTVVGIGSGTAEAGFLVNSGGAAPAMIFLNNVASCSKGAGIEVRGGPKDNHIFRGNIIGMNASGLGTTFGNVYTGLKFVPSGAVNLIIGGTTAADRNIISMNGRSAVTIPSCTGTDGCGILLERVNGVTIQGNYIGVDATGLTAAGNGSTGIQVNGGCSAVVIGGSVAGSGNIISSNGFNCSDGTAPNARHGIQFVNANGTNNFVRGNYVGLGADGTTLLGNSEEGVSSYQCGNITIGGATSLERNYIAGSRKGVYLQVGAAINCKVIGNYIGLDITGMIVKPCSLGVHINGAAGNFIGGPNPGEGNIISGNTAHGILLEDADNTTIQQNWIGIKSNGSFPAANGGDGIRIKQQGAAGTTGVLIGSPTNTALGNIIAYNANGVNIMDAASMRNQIRRNSIYCNGAAQVNGINLNGVGNINIQISPLISTAPYITAPNPGINGTFTNQAGLAATDVIEVFWDNACGTCQGKTYLGDATSLNTPAAGDWTFAPLPAASDCAPKGGAGCLVGVTNITATRTDNNGNTSQFMSCDPVFLPVTLTSFSVKRSSGSDVLVSWSTSSEKDNAYFEILRSTDGVNFTSVGRVEGAGNSAILLNYSFTDYGLAPGTYYYMLSQVDFDGEQTISEIRPVTLGEGSVDIITVAGGVKVINLSKEAIDRISIVDMSGQILAEDRNVDEKETIITTMSLAPGVYLVKAETAVGVVIEKILVY